MISGTTSSNSSKDPPSGKELHALHDRIGNTINKVMVKRGEACDRSMRQLAQKRKERIALEREQELAEEAKRIKREKKEKGRKRTAEEMEEEGATPGVSEGGEGGGKTGLPSVGAHGVARQDGVGVHEGKQSVSLPL